MPGISFIPGPGDSGKTAFERALDATSFATQLSQQLKQSQVQTQLLSGQLQTQALQQQAMQLQNNLQQQYAPAMMQSQMQQEQAKTQLLGIQAQTAQAQLPFVGQEASMNLALKGGQIGLQGAQQADIESQTSQRAATAGEQQARGQMYQSLAQQEQAKARMTNLDADAYQAALQGTPDAIKAELKMMGFTDSRVIDQFANNVHGPLAQKALETGMQGLTYQNRMNDMLQQKLDLQSQNEFSQGIATISAKKPGWEGMAAYLSLKSGDDPQKQAAIQAAQAGLSQPQYQLSQLVHAGADKTSVAQAMATLIGMKGDPAKTTGIDTNGNPVNKVNDLATQGAALVAQLDQQQAAAKSAVTTPAPQQQIAPSSSQLIPTDITQEEHTQLTTSGKLPSDIAYQDVAGKFYPIIQSKEQLSRLSPGSPFYDPYKKKLQYTPMR